jgi:iron(II)-dependent oxidoreductase
MSPLLWDLGHIADFERLWLIDAVEGRSEARLEERFDALDTPRNARAGLELPDKATALAALERVRRDTLALLQAARLDGGDPLLRDGYVYRMVMQHEAQHQETMLQALDLPEEGWGYERARNGVTDQDAAAASDLATRRNAPMNQGRGDDRGAAPAERTIDDTERVRIAAGAFDMGTDDRTRAYDNERGRHRVKLPVFEIERYPVSNRRWCAFIDEGGYQGDELWSREGRDWRDEAGAAHPQGWRREDDVWRAWSFGTYRPLDPMRPVQHVSYWEAEAFARWCDARLPSEAEWEKAAAGNGAEGEGRSRMLPWRDTPESQPDTAGSLVSLATAPDTRDWGPPPLGARPAMVSPSGVEELHGSVYQWTSSPLTPYPGFEAFPYPGYSEVFFGDTYRVLRGSSWVSGTLLWRNTYRNWDLPQRRQIFAGVRLVYDA